MDLLEGVMAFAVVMIVLSTIVTGLTEGALRFLAMRQKVLTDAVRTFLEREILPQVGDALRARYGNDEKRIADMFARRLTLNPVTPRASRGADDFALVDPRRGLISRWRRRLGFGVERLTTHSLLQRIAKSEIGDAFAASFVERATASMVAGRIDAAQTAAAGAPVDVVEAVDDLSTLAEAAEEAVAAREVWATGAPERGERAEASIDAKLRTALDLAKEETQRIAIRNAVDAMRETFEDISRAARVESRIAAFQTGLRDGDFRDAVEDLARDIRAQVKREVETADDLQAKVAELGDAVKERALLAIDKTASDPAVQEAVRELAEVAGAALGDASADFVRKGFRAAQERLEDTLNDLSRTYERYVAGANEVFKARAHGVTFAIAFTVCLIGNVDAGRVFGHLMDSPATRTQLIGEIEGVVAANEEALKNYNAVLAALSKTQSADDLNVDPDSDIGFKSVEEAKAFFVEAVEPLKELNEAEGLPIGPDYYPYCGDDALDFLKKLTSVEGRVEVGAACRASDKGTGDTEIGGADRTPLMWLLNVLAASALVSLGGPFWYKVFTSLGQLTQLVRQLGGGGRRETIEEGAPDQPASDEALKNESIGETFMVARAGRIGAMSGPPGR